MVMVQPKARKLGRRPWSCLVVVAVFIAVSIVLCACSSDTDDATTAATDGTASTARYLSVIESEPDTCDFQCTSIYYDVAYGVFDRLVETRVDGGDGSDLSPSLAKSWEVTDDGLTYTFHLRDDVTFSNGSPLTSADVLYTFERLLTHPDSCNRDILIEVAGAAELAEGEADTLAGFEIISDHDFAVTLRQPFAPFLAGLATGAASIVDDESCEAAGDAFGIDPAKTIGCGPYVFESWTKHDTIVLAARDDYWGTGPANDGIVMHFVTDAELIQLMFDDGKLDILDTDDVADAAEYYVHGDIYRDRLVSTQELSLTYIALNESEGPLADVRVRHALQLALDRQMLLDAVYSGRGLLENGIFPHGLAGFNPDLPEIAYDPAEAKRLIAEAGYAGGFDIEIAVRASSTQWDRHLAEQVADMWAQVGVDAKVSLMDEEDFMTRRKAGELDCYAARWTADFNDPDNFIYTFFGTPENSRFRSICYANDDVMERVRAARAITDQEARMEEYHALEQTIVQDDCAWIPLFSKTHYYVSSPRLERLVTSWTGWVSSRYRDDALVTN